MMETESTPRFQPPASNNDPDDDLPNWLAPRGVVEHPDKTHSRMQSAKQMDADIVAVAQGIYEVRTKDETYTVNLDAMRSGEHHAAGICKDYMYNCAEIDIDCKHILAAKNAVREGEAPPVYVDPDEWMDAQLSELYQQTISIHEDAIQPSVEKSCSLLLTKIENLREENIQLANPKRLKQYFKSEVKEPATLIDI